MGKDPPRPWSDAFSNIVNLTAAQLAQRLLSTRIYSEQNHRHPCWFKGGRIRVYDGSLDIAAARALAADVPWSWNYAMGHFHTKQPHLKVVYLWGEKDRSPTATYHLMPFC